MIYSDDINKVCALCIHSMKIEGDEEQIKCILKNAFLPFNDTCKKFEYDIFKKPVRRRRRKKKEFKKEDFSL